MINLTNLVKEYRQTKNKQILDKIYIELKSTIQQKAKFIYYAKWYPLNLYHPCKYCRNCDKLNEIPKTEHNTICKDCDKCKCVKGFFNLKKDNLCEYEDIENDLWLEVLRIVDNFDITKDFNTYLFSCVWEFIPTFITKDFVKSLSNKSLTQQDEEGNETQIDISEEKEEPKLSLEEILKVATTKREKELINLFLNDKKMTQEKAGEIMGISQQAISLIFNKLQRKLKKLLVK
jgi:RNA polymerase sigma factor (sigma-70 family)